MPRRKTKHLFRRDTGPGALVLATCLASGCTVEEIDLAGRSCPCTEGWSCDEATQICVETEGSALAGAIDVVSFKADWATPNAIRWSWELEGNAEDFHAFQVAMGKTPEEVAARSWLITGVENPELDRFTLPRTSGEDPVRGTIVYELEEDTTYYAQLIVIDTAGQTSTSSNVAQKRTGLPPLGGEIDIMVDGPPATLGYTLPPCMSLGSDAYAGAAAYEYKNRCQAPPPMGDPIPTCEAPASSAPLCWENLFLEGMSIPIEAELDSGVYDEAYIEVAVRIDDSQHAFWGSVGLRPVGAGYDGLRGLNAITFRADGAYRLYQFKLDALPFEYAELTPGIETFYIGGGWSDGATVHFDEVRIRW